MGIREDNNMIHMIANRAALFYLRQGVSVKSEFIANELKICHEEICPLRLDGLLDAELHDLMHDVSGIHQHMDILDGSFRERWHPRFAK